MGHLGTAPPSRRTPPSSKAPEKQARLVHTYRKDCSGRDARMRFPGASVLCLSPPLVAALSLMRLAIRSGQSHPGSQTHPPQLARQRLKSHRPRATRPPDRFGGARASVPSVALPPTSPRMSPHAIVYRVVRRHTPYPVLRSLGDRCERHKHEPRLECTLDSQPQRHHQKRATRPATDPRSA